MKEVPLCVYLCVCMYVCECVSSLFSSPSPVRFHFTTGKFPFEGENVYKLFGAISTGVFEMPSDLSPLLQELLRGLLRKDATERFSIPEIRSHA